ncbi:unnamed protein product [Symbiodinium sp. CCMP2456]|nr:unnamed protein product [Symbiodinium sp. CCMP2456]
MASAHAGIPPPGEMMSRTWSRWPWTAKSCVILTGLQVVSCLAAHSSCQAGPVYRGSLEDEIQVFSMTRNALIIPMALITLVFGFQVAEMCSSKPRQRALAISRAPMLLFAVKICYYTMLSRGHGLAFQNQRSPDYRPIYVTRWIGWTYAIPTVLFMNLYPLMDSHPMLEVLLRILPQLAASAAYCWACGLGSVLYDPWMGWFLTLLGCAAYAAVVADEVVYLTEHMRTTSQPTLKGASVCVKEVMFVAYTVIFLLGNMGIVSSYSCQLFYSVTDISHLAVLSSLLFVYWNLDDPKLTATADHRD